MNESVETTSPEEAPTANQFELNTGDNFIFAIDVSGSMQNSDCPGNKSRIEYSKENAITFAKEAAKYDTDGIDVLTFGHTVTEYRGVTGEKAEEIIGALKATESSTKTAEVIQKAYDMHKASGKPQTVLFVVTDGAPDSKDAVKTTITNIANDIKDEHEFAISFLTVGKIDDGLRAFLTALDDDLKEAKHDIVDVKALDEVDFLSAFAGALHD